MIVSIGTDIVDIKRIEKQLNSSRCELFLEKTYTEDEQKLAENYKNPAFFYAGRWAAKEAVAKALGTGFGSQCSWKEVNIIRLESGAPKIQLSGNTLTTAENLGINNWHLSISHEREYAIAYVIAEK